MARNEQFLKVQARVKKIREMYAESASQYQNFLIYGDYGTGKTTLLTTCPKPIFIDSFDSGGTKTRALQPLIESGDLIVENKWEKDSWKDPWAFQEWEREMAEREREGFFEAIGTYCLDSITSWTDSMMFRVLMIGGDSRGSRKGKKPELQDYGMVQITALDWLGVMMGYNCHTVVTGHIGIDKDEVSGRMETGLLLANRLAGKVPLVFDEKYITKMEREDHRLQTKNDGVWKAETRMGGDQFDMLETPDIKALLRKAGKDDSDKPSLFEEIEEDE